MEVLILSETSSVLNNSTVVYVRFVICLIDVNISFYHTCECSWGRSKDIECCVQFHHMYNKGCIPSCVCEDTDSMSYILSVGVCLRLGSICHHKNKIWVLWECPE